MPKIWSPALIGILLLAVPALAQPEARLLPPIIQQETPPRPTLIDAVGPYLAFDAAAPRAPFRIWATSEYLLWRTRSSSLPQVTTGDPINATFPGAFGQVGTQVVGGGNVNLGTFAGGRLTVGAWLTDRFGFEVSGFLLEQHIRRVGLASDAAGNPALAFPLSFSNLGREGAFTISDPTFPQSGSVQMSLQSQLWGTEANALFRGYRGNNLALTWIAGFRYMDLTESAQIRTDAINQTVGAEFTHTTIDSFCARNQFYGGQVGIDLDYRYNRFSLGLTAKVALGVNHQTVAVAGQDIQSGVGSFPAPGALNEGVFAQSSNIGRFQRDQFSVIPHVQAKLGYDILRNVTVFAGYDFLYWSNVVRAGNQIDRNINFSQSQVFGAGALTGPADPSSAFRRTDYWAHGVSFGVSIRY